MPLHHLLLVYCFCGLLTCVSTFQLALGSNNLYCLRHFLNTFSASAVVKYFFFANIYLPFVYFCCPALLLAVCNPVPAAVFCNYALPLTLGKKYCINKSRGRQQVGQVFRLFNVFPFTHKTQ